MVAMTAAAIAWGRWQGVAEQGAILNLADLMSKDYRVSVLTAMKDGRDDQGTLSDGDKKKILANISDDVLASRRYPTVSFESTGVREQGNTRVVIGNLTLHGQTRSVTATVREDGAHWTTDVTLQQTQFGIKPYNALMGALKVKDDVRVTVRVPKS